MSFQTALSGLNASSKNLDVIGNNVANSSTVGFKASTAEFADVFAASLSGAGASQAGIGTKLAAVAQQFTQGHITTTNNPLDVAVNGKGFFVLSNNGARSYTRNGQFQVDKNNNIVTSGGLLVQGYQVDNTDPANPVITGKLGNLTVDTKDQNPHATNAATVGANLDANSKILPDPADLTATTWVPPDPSATPPVLVKQKSYNSSTSTTVYDSLGNPHVVGMYFIKTAANTWNVQYTIDGSGVAAAGGPSVLTFTSAGVIDSGTPPSGTSVTFTLPPTLGATMPAVDFKFDSMTQFGSKFGVNSLTQNGYASGSLAGFSIGKDGILQGRYTNGQTRTLGQLALANFANPQGLQNLGDNQWAESPNSGTALIGSPGSSGLGLLQSSATEDSNVDLTAELVNMIVAQRAYQANAQTIKTQDAIQQTLMNLR